MRQHGRRTGQQQRNGGDVASEQRPTTKGNDFLPSIFPLVKCKSNNIIDCVIEPREVPFAALLVLWMSILTSREGGFVYSLILPRIFMEDAVEMCTEFFLPLLHRVNWKRNMCHWCFTTRDAENQFIADEDRDENMSVCCLLLFENFYDMGKIVLNKLG